MRAAVRLACLALALLALPAAARAQVGAHKEYQPSPRWFAVELKFGPYKPDVDKEFGSAAQPYRDIFGKGLGVMSQATFDFEFLKKHGVLGVGGTLGFFTRSGKALLADGTASGDYTDLFLMPLVLQLVYRWDYLAERWRVPIVPYVRAGIVYALWWVTAGDGNLARFGDGGKKAYGGTWGYQINAGLSLLLDLLEPGSSKRLDSETGINHFYLFAEFVHSRIDNFGASDKMRLGMNIGMLAGITVEF